MTTMLNEQRNKRLLSPESSIQPVKSKLDKRQRQDSLEIDEDNLSQINMDPVETPPEDLKTWMARISGQLTLAAQKSDLEELATKQDLDIMRDNITAQGAEINQLRQELADHKKDLDELRSTFDRNEARNINRMQQSAGRYLGQGQVNNMAATAQPQQTRTQNARRNLVFEGLKGTDDNEMLTSLLEITTALGLIVYKRDVDMIYRMRRRDPTDKTPGPVLITFNRITIRDNILKNKFNLRHIEGMNGVYVNADEPIEIQRIKATFRKVAAKARELGEEVELRHNCITISGECFMLDELNRIPSKFLPTNKPKVDPSETNTDLPESNMDIVNEEMKDGEARAADPTQPTRGRTAAAKRIIKPDLILPGEKMRVCKSGLCFSGPTAYPSNMHKTPIIYKKIEYNSNEQAYQCVKATNHDKPDLASFLKELSDACDIKVEASNITTSKEWNDEAPDLLWDMFDQKMKQHPELLERLIQTAPLMLIEASTSLRWGGGAPFHSKLYDTGKYPGHNVFGKIATRYRDEEITRREANKCP